MTGCGCKARLTTRAGSYPRRGSLAHMMLLRPHFLTRVKALALYRGHTAVAIIQARPDRRGHQKACR
jgi:hypothetical protein